MKTLQASREVVAIDPGATAPPIRRASMTARPWFGFLRGLLLALWPGMPRWAPAPDAAPWRAAARRRRLALATIVLGLAAGAAAWQFGAAPPEPGAAWWVYSMLLVLLFTWVATGFATALAGAWVLWRGDPFALDAAPGREDAMRAPLHRGARTAVVMPVCNEDITTVFGGLRATCESLAATGALALFDLYVLSDTSDPALRAAELRAWQELRATLGDTAAPGAGARLFYRWRRRRTKRKAGNVADFCRRWGRNYRYMVVLDADSTMHGDTLVALVRLMEANPRAGIVQTLPQPCGHGTLHARAQQFAHRVTGRLTSLGMAFWQLGDSHYWGHNAILRVEPFMRHCALAKLPGHGGLAGEILSHDFVEAALMARAGFEVWLAPSLGGSWEQNPPHLLDELQRDRRWCQGNLQNLRLVAEPGWRPAHRTMFAAAAFSYLAAPLWLLFVACGLVLGFAPGLAGAGHAGGHGGSGSGTGVGLWAATLALLVAPRALAVGTVWLRREQAPYGGTWRLAASALVEMLLSALQAPLRALAHSAYVLSALTGLRLEWRSPARQADAVPWREACSRLGWLALPALALLAGGAPAWLVALPLLLAVPLVVAGARPALGARIERLGLLWNPEARRPPRTLARAGETRSLAWLVPPQVAAAPPAPGARARAPAAAPFGRPRGALAVAGALSFAVLAAMPRIGIAPEAPATAPEQFAARAVPVAAEVVDPLVVRRVAQAERPARWIDDALRQRAREAVQRALEQEREVFEVIEEAGQAV